MARTYRKEFTTSEEFPAAVGEEWIVQEGSRVCERWKIVSTSRKGFTVRITELYPMNGVPMRVGK